MEEITFRLKLLREFLEYTRKDFANILGVDNSQYSKIEQGKLNLTVLHIMELCSKTKANINWLLSGEGEMIRVGNIINGDRNPVGNNHGFIKGENIGDNSINISGPTSGSQKIIHPDKTIEIEQSAQDTISRVAESQASYMSASDTIAFQKEIISELQTEIIRLQKIIINGLESKNEH